MKEIEEIVSKKEQDDMERIIYISFGVLHFLDEVVKIKQEYLSLVNKKISEILFKRYGVLMFKVYDFIDTISNDEIQKIMERQNKNRKAEIESNYINFLAVVYYEMLQGLKEDLLKESIIRKFEIFKNTYGKEGIKVYLEYKDLVDFK